MLPTFYKVKRGSPNLVPILSSWFIFCSWITKLGNPNFWTINKMVVFSPSVVSNPVFTNVVCRTHSSGMWDPLECQATKETKRGRTQPSSHPRSCSAAIACHSCSWEPLLATPSRLHRPLQPPSLVISTICRCSLPHPNTMLCHVLLIPWATLAAVAPAAYQSTYKSCFESDKWIPYAMSCLESLTRAFYMSCVDFGH